MCWLLGAGNEKEKCPTGEKDKEGGYSFHHSSFKMSLKMLPESKGKV
jgi:hypothetical protein